MNRDEVFYLLIIRPQGPQIFGPFETEQQRNDYAGALWFGDPAKMPWEMRGKRQSWFDKDCMHLHYLNVRNGRLTAPTNVTVIQLIASKSFVKRMTNRKVLRGRTQ